ncbi:MAG: TatD family hydrolase [Candidatus Promineifilaceae bacterium]
MQLIDTHCHLDFGQFDKDRDEMIQRALDAGVTRMILPAVDLRNSEAVLKLAEQYDCLYAAVGVHPNSTVGWTSAEIKTIESLAKHPKVVAIGEIGVDYHWDKSPKATQHRAFMDQMELAADLNLPIIIHNRKASEDVIDLMAASSLVGRANAGVMHSFSAPVFAAERALEMGFYLGFTGPLTYKKANDLRRIAAQVPLDRILLETDAPFLSPTPKRGKRNEPSYVPYIAERMAALHQVSEDEIGRITTANAERLFGIPSIE